MPQSHGVNPLETLSLGQLAQMEGPKPRTIARARNILQRIAHVFREYSEEFPGAIQVRDCGNGCIDIHVMNGGKELTMTVQPTDTRPVIKAVDAQILWMLRGSR